MKHASTLSAKNPRLDEVVERVISHLEVVTQSDFQRLISKLKVVLT